MARNLDAEQTRDAMAAALAAASTADQLRALWREWVGHDEAAASPDELRGDLADYIREVCYSAGIDCPREVA